ncbi:hypothetical protein H0B56_13930 [Haloechinothrix sp. YIM 98757]|uniref:Lysozyme n=2 Tax=Haloechinothrix aidingensis TaxID=2752311 RepID=A0A838ABN3_9PSEU|nr:hypothetical protein [Haloechinothrix aidingensis]
MSRVPRRPASTRKAILAVAAGILLLVAIFLPDRSAPDGAALTELLLPGELSGDRDPAREQGRAEVTLPPLPGTLPGQPRPAAGSLDVPVGELQPVAEWVHVPLVGPSPGGAGSLRVPLPGLAPTTARLEPPMPGSLAREGYPTAVRPDAGAEAAGSGRADGATAARRPEERPATQWGIDVSGWQGDVDWQRWWEEGKRFAYVKATEGTTFTNPYFARQYRGAHEVGMIRGAYHFALPDRSGGAAQARHFVANGGHWLPDGRTLPGVLDIEFNPYGETCYGRSPSGVVGWIEEFADTYESHTGRSPVIYTNTMWWRQCVGQDRDLELDNPLWIVRYATETGELPPEWDDYTFWQYTTDPLDSNEFNGNYRDLVELAGGWGAEDVPADGSR